MPVDPMTIALAAETAGKVGKGIFDFFSGGKKRKRLPQFTPLDYLFTLPPEALALLEEQDLRNLDAITRQAGVGAGMRERGLRARGIFDAPALGAGRASIFGEAAPLKAGILSERAGRQMGLIQNLNAFRDLQNRSKYEADVGRATAINAIPGGLDILGSLTGDIGSTIGTSILTRGQQQREDAQQQELLRLLERLLGRGSNSYPWEQDYGTR